MKKLFLLGISSFLWSFSAFAAEAPHQTLADKIAEKPLWLTDRSSDAPVLLSLALHSGLSKKFIETGAYDRSVYAKGCSVFCGSPRCEYCPAHGVIAAADIEAYIGQGPFWVGVRNVGGGFTLHRDTWSGAPSATPQQWPVKERVEVTVLSPAFMVGATLGGLLGGFDIALGFEPAGLAINGAMPTSHGKGLIEMHGYTPALKYKSLGLRLFAGAQAAYTDSATNREWEVCVHPGGALSGLAGLQGTVAFVRFGVAYGQHYQMAGKSEIVAQDRYTARLAEYEQEALFRQEWQMRRSAGGNTAQSVQLAPTAPPVLGQAQHAHVVASYLGLSFGSVTLGCSSQVEIDVATGLAKPAIIQLALSCAL